MVQQILEISLIGGLINLDDVPFIQTMVSQPIVAAPLIGGIFGNFRAGLIVGAFLELLMVCFFPVGCSVPVDGSLTAIVATGICLLAGPVFPGPREALIPLSILLALPFGILAQKVSILVRRFNGKISDQAQRVVLDDKPGKIDLLHLSGMGLFYLRSFSLCFISLLIVVPLLKISIPLFSKGFFHGLKLLYFAYPITGIALVFDTFRNRALYGLFALSFLLATLFSTIWPLSPWMAFGIPCLLVGMFYGIREALKESGRERSRE